MNFHADSRLFLSRRIEIRRWSFFSSEHLNPETIFTDRALRSNAFPTISAPVRKTRRLKFVRFDRLTSVRLSSPSEGSYRQTELSSPSPFVCAHYIIIYEHITVGGKSRGVDTHKSHNVFSRTRNTSRWNWKSDGGTARFADPVDTIVVQKRWKIVRIAQRSAGHSRCVLLFGVRVVRSEIFILL